MQISDNYNKMRRITALPQDGCASNRNMLYYFDSLITTVEWRVTATFYGNNSYSTFCVIIETRTSSSYSAAVFLYKFAN